MLADAESDGCLQCACAKVFRAYFSQQFEAPTSPSGRGGRIDMTENERFQRNKLAELRTPGLARQRLLREPVRMNSAIQRPRSDAAHAPRRRPDRVAVRESLAIERLAERLKQCRAACRARRTEMSLLLFDAQVAGRAHDELSGKIAPALRTTFERVCELEGWTEVSIEPLGAALSAAVLQDCNRCDAVALARRFIDTCRRETFQKRSAYDGVLPTVHVGVASIASITKNFSVELLLKSSEQCLTGAQSCSTHAAKSIEVF